MLRLIDPQDPAQGVQIDEGALRELAGFVVDQAFPGARTEDSMVDHGYHDERHFDCVHCAIAHHHTGGGHAVAVAQLAFEILSAGGPAAFRTSRCLLMTDGADNCCDDYAIDHPGARFCPRCQIVNEGAYPSAAGVRGAQ